MSCYLMLKDSPYMWNLDILEVHQKILSVFYFSKKKKKVIVLYWGLLGCGIEMDRNESDGGGGGGR